MEFDKIITVPCVAGVGSGSGELDPVTCQPVGGGTGGGGGGGGGGGSDGDGEPGPSDDPRCADPAFRDANPEICAGYPILILKPEYVLLASGQNVQYKTYLRASGAEHELTSGLTYNISDFNIGVITSHAGLFTGSAPGLATISVTWVGNPLLSAQAMVEVTETCSAVHTNFMILIDNSESSKVGFNSSFASRLSYAKEAAIRFARSVNYSKDKVGVAYFNSSGSVVLELGTDPNAIVSAISSIVATTAKTDIATGLDVVMDYFSSIDGNNAIVLFSDGENNQGSDPVPIADQWKSANRTIIVIALRAWGTFFNTLYRISTSGFFLSAYNATAQSVIETLKGLKTYLCSGDCVPEAGTFPAAQLNYNGFINWDVFQGQVDLVGLGNWDVQPGNGLYVDLAGTKGIDGFTSADQIEPGGLVSKITYHLEAGKNYRFQIDVGGNNVTGAEGPNDNASVRVQITDGVTTWLDQTIRPTSWDQALTQFTFNFTAGATGDAYIRIEMLEDAAENAANVGPLIDDIILQNLSDSLILLSDDFNNENPTITPPGQVSYYGCLESPPGAQQADPTPPTPPLED